MMKYFVLVVLFFVGWAVVISSPAYSSTGAVVGDVQAQFNREFQREIQINDGTINKIYLCTDEALNGNDIGGLIREVLAGVRPVFSIETPAVYEFKVLYIGELMRFRVTVFNSSCVPV